MLETTYLNNHFLIAMPNLLDPNFFHTVTYVFVHNAEGAMGIVVNRPTNICLGDILEHMEITAVEESIKHIPIFEGGPVQKERGFVIHPFKQEWDATYTVSEDLGVTTSRDILGALAMGEGPEKRLIALGYAGWGAGQLEQELVDNTWLSVPADQHILFNVPVHKRWQAAAAKLGVDVNLISSQAGHG
jgi:putative transcriptional regulator